MTTFTLSEIPEEEKIKILRNSSKIVEEAPYHPGYEDVTITDDAGMAEQPEQPEQPEAKKPERHRPAYVQRIVKVRRCGGCK